MPLPIYFVECEARIRGRLARFFIETDRDENSAGGVRCLIRNDPTVIRVLGAIHPSAVARVAFPFIDRRRLHRLQSEARLEFRPGEDASGATPGLSGRRLAVDPRFVRQVARAIGRSDPIGAYPAERPVDPPEIVGTIYKSLGFDLETTLPGPAGRPFPLVDFGKHEVKELF